MITKTYFTIVNGEKLFNLDPITVDGKCEFETIDEAKPAHASLRRLRKQLVLT